MKHKVLTIVLLSMVAIQGLSQSEKVKLNQTSALWIDSKVVNDKYLIQCYIPDEVSVPLDSLPIVFVLDADIAFGMTYDIVRLIRLNNEIPEVAIIGISYGGWNQPDWRETDWWKKRHRDYSMSLDKAEVWGKFSQAGGGEKFIQFIENELFPFISFKFGLNNTDRTIVGLSLGGLISMDILFFKPELFQKYVIASPALQWNDREVFKKEQIFSERNQSLNAVVYTSIGSLDHKENFVDPWHDFNKQIEARNYKGLVYRTTIFENETHLSVFPSALTKGLKFVLNYTKH